MPTCTLCNVLSDESYFYSSTLNKDGLTGRCKACRVLCVQNWRKKHPHKDRDNKMKRLYGLTPENYAALSTLQNNECAICHTTTPGFLLVDHCHTSGKIRGLLCNNCNIFLGHAKDDIDILFTAIKYLITKGP